MIFKMAIDFFGAYITGTHGQSQNLYEQRNEWKRGRGSKEAVEKLIELESNEIMGLEKKLGLDFVVDPMFGIYYLFQPFAENVKGVSVGPQENWFNNNVFSWTPQIEGPLEIQTGFTQKYLHLDELPKDGSASVILPSPYTLLMLSHVKGYSDRFDAITNLAKLLHAESEHLASMGIGRIQYDEPAIVVKQSLGSLTQEDLSLLSRGMDICGRVKGATTSLHTYFGNAGPIIPYLINLPVDCIGIDGTETSLNEIVKHEYLGKELALGLIDARSTSTENPQEIAMQLKEVVNKTNPKKIYLTPNTGTEYRGYTNGIKKMELLEEIKRRLNG